jgi:hypothetical protein
MRAVCSPAPRGRMAPRVRLALFLCGSLALIPHVCASVQDATVLESVVGGTWRKLHVESPPDTQVPERHCVATRTVFGSKLVVDEGVGLYRIPHSTIRVDGVRCGPLAETASADALWLDNHMLLARAQLLLDKNLSVAKNAGAMQRDLFDPNDRHGKAQAVFNKFLEFGLEMWVGYHGTSDLKCGNTTVLPRTSFSIFSRSDRYLDIGGFVGLPNTTQPLEYKPGELIYMSFDEPFSEQREYKDRIVRQPPRACPLAPHGPDLRSGD